jgi:hypothetical protein
LIIELALGNPLAVFSATYYFDDVSANSSRAGTHDTGSTFSLPGFASLGSAVCSANCLRDHSSALNNCSTRGIVVNAPTATATDSQKPSNQTMKPMALFQNNLRMYDTAPCRGLSLLARRKTMSFQKNVDEKIKEAIARGEFDNLPGKGKPLDLDTYFATPEHLRMGYSILKSADIIPEEMELLRQIEDLKKSLDSSTTPIERKALRQQLSEKLTNFNMRMERNRKKQLIR